MMAAATAHTKDDTSSVEPSNSRYAHVPTAQDLTALAADVYLRTLCGLKLVGPNYFAGV